MQRQRLTNAAVVAAIVIGAIFAGYSQASYRAEWGAFNFAAQSLAAERFGARTFALHSTSDPVPSVLAWSNGQGVAGVLIAASTADSAPVNQAARCCRRHGKVVLVGVVGLRSAAVVLRALDYRLAGGPVDLHGQ